MNKPYQYYRMRFKSYIKEKNVIRSICLRLTVQESVWAFVSFFCSCHEESRRYGKMESNPPTILF